MKRVLIPVGSWKCPPDSRHPFLGLRQPYVEKLRQHSLQPLLVPSHTDEKELDDYLSISNGVLFIGGPDLAPHYYGQEKHPKTLATDPQRDKLELLILKRILEDDREIPFLGICRGMQVAAIAGGGELYQHLPDITEEIHDELEPGVSSYDHLPTNPKHKVNLAIGSKLHTVFHRAWIEMNSGHHQAVKEPGYFIVTGTTDGGIIEVIQHPERSNFFAIQCHAELQPELDPLFDAFAEDIRNFNATHASSQRSLAL